MKQTSVKFRQTKPTLMKFERDVNLYLSRNFELFIVKEYESEQVKESLVQNLMTLRFMLMTTLLSMLEITEIWNFSLENKEAQESQDSSTLFRKPWKKRVMCHSWKFQHIVSEARFGHERASIPLTADGLRCIIAVNPDSKERLVALWSQLEKFSATMTSLTKWLFQHHHGQRRKD